MHLVNYLRSTLLSRASEQEVRTVKDDLIIWSQ